MKTVSEVRSEFLEFFKGRGHEVVPSSPLIPQNDPTLMFVAAGMVQFKDVFTGKEKRDYSRAASSQKCVRAGGKHNDLDNVGYTARHHTFFEMLGNFSFGDYFKDDAIAMAWELVTKNFALSEDKLLVTVHSTDEEAAEIWKKVTGWGDDKVIRIPTSDNFWAMGDTGPCGPCTEIFYDHGENIPGGPPGSADEDGDRFVEIWNNVFMQFEQVTPDERIDLPAPSVDTGMGLERIAAIMQGKHDNYDIDLLRSIIEHSADLTGISPDGEQSASHRVIADHLRCSTFLLADGVMPSNEGRGYVLRRIMRRGMRHAHLLGAEDPLMYRLLPTLIDNMGEAYPELRRAESMVSETLKNEEERFKKTLDRGLRLLDEETEKVSSGKKFPGDVAFKLYDTYGFPVDLTQDALRAQGIEVDMAGFEACMEKQREQARANWAGSGDVETEKIWFEILEEFGPTEFLGYETEETEAQILTIVKDGKRVDEAGLGDFVYVVTNQTPFYAESGGQVGDNGKIYASDNRMFDVDDTQKMAGKIFAHYGEVGDRVGLKVGDAVKLHVDRSNRSAIRANHSATHLLHAALREKLGDHVTQKGSLVDANRLRFDISHPKGLTEEEIREIEERVNNEISAATEVKTVLMDQEAAIEAGAMALFGEKYDDEVRVLTMGTEVNGKPFSLELCGGTHVSNTGDIKK
jgi:alanyl-tRNA synthetase